MREQQRLKVLGVDPRLVVVLEFHSTIDDAEIHRNDMVLLDGSDRHAVVAFADDPSFAIFNERLHAYRGPIPDGQKGPSYEAFFDAIISIRVYGPQDRISSNCAEYVAALESVERLRLDVQCWHPADSNLASEWIADLRTAAEAAAGEIVTVYRNDAIGVMIARVYLPSARLAEFAELDVIASINLLPATDLTRAELYSLTPSDLPEVVAPARHAPILGLIDSGVASAHPLLAGAIQAAETLSPHIADGEDRHGHGTMVASLALHGPIADAIRQPRLVPIARIVSVAVLDSDAQFPDGSLWEQDIADAIEYCASQGARVINLSLGDPSRPFKPPRQHAISAIVDDLARRHDLVIVASVGNSDPATYLRSNDPARNYVIDLLADPETGILPPGTAALALTVGGFSPGATAGGYASREPVERIPFGSAGWPASITRAGPGVERAVKPELVAPSGTHAHEPGRPFVRDAELDVVGATIGGTGRLLGTDFGTSFAAPLVSRVALGVLARFPAFSANLTRALVLLGARPTWDGAELEVTGTAQTSAARKVAVRRLNGFGQTTLDRTLEVSPHRAVLVAEGTIAMNGVHIYDLPLPSSFYSSGGKRYLDVALGFDPPTRSQRLDYLGNKIEFYVVRDIEMGELVDIFTKAADEAEDDSDELEDDTDEDVDSDVDSPDARPSRGLSKLLGSRNLKFDTSVVERSRSANQRGGLTFGQVLSAPTTAGAYVVVRSINRWCDDTAEQPYALAVSLRRDEGQPEIYTELAARLEAVAELEVEVEGEIEL